MADSTNLNSNFITDFIDEDLANGVNTRVQTRFPPEPNGYLHIGHAKAICIDFSIAEKYGGICNLRLDDTNPSKEDVEYVDAIKEDIEWLGYKWNEVYYASSYFDFLYECAIKLIKEGKAYVCDLSPDEIREYRGTLTEPGKNSPYRDRSVEENLDLFRRMTEGEFANGEKGASRQDRHGEPKYQYARPRHLQNSARLPSSDGRQVVRLSDVRFRASPLRRCGESHLLPVLARVRESQAAL